jgi:lipopolysaccharide transport system permease protein
LILIIFLVVYRHVPDLSGLAWFPVAVAIQLVFTLALALFLSALTVHFRDIRDLLANLLTFWFFATPIVYPYFLDSVVSVRWLFDYNPFFHLAASYQEILFFAGPVGHAKWLLALGGISLVLFVLAYWTFDRLRDSFAEAV